ncbi:MULTISPECIES: hypothetical protein [Citricoccus]|uniref:DUF4157 domain-containing protein n=1 Tax=Citricoccus muralis TaxID=169134 RepID=A0ABY8H3B6_9MICC|nr:MULTISPECIES: hypothetical protein [Citricoccus]WBL18005.1 hypothetical protein O1A05_09320 [Citricoccus sp. NR2]WFP15609.1 hypothetical protein P8192_09360 [Citricoccus muralis]
MSTVRTWWNLLNGSTVLGLLIAVASRTTLRPGPRGTLLAQGYTWGFPNGGAITIGNVILVRPGVRCTEALLRHEDRHVSQYAFCLGLPFLILYAVSVAVSLAVCGDTASANPFERAAGLADGGYRAHPPRWRRTHRRIST